jgi:phage terminase small subunit
MNKLSDRHRLFCDNYLVTADITKASSAAGYLSYNHEVLDKPEVKAYLKEKRRKLNNVIGLDFWWKARRLETLINSVIGREGDPDSVDMQYANIAISAIAELNKMQGHHAPEKSIVVNLEHDAQLKLVNEMTMQLLKQMEIEDETKEQKEK